MTHNKVGAGENPCVAIIAQKTIPQALQYQTTFGQAILDSILDTIFRVSRAGFILDFKLSKEYPLLLSSSEVLGQRINAILPSQAWKDAMDGIAITLGTGEIQLFEYDLINDEKTMNFEARVTKVGEDDVLFIVRNISEQRKSEACGLALLNIAVKVQKEKSLEEIISFACERIMTIFGVRLVWVGRKENDASVKLSTIGGEPSEYLEGVVFRWDDSPEGKGITGTTIRTGKFQLMNIEDLRMLLWRERLTQYSVTSGAGFPLKVGGSILGALTICTDNHEFWTKSTIIHLTNFAEQVALAMYFTTNRQQIKLLTTGMKFNPHAIVITNRTGDIQWSNPSFQELNGYSEADAMSSNVRILESCEQPQSFYKAIRKHILSGKIWNGIIVNRRKDGGQYIAETTITPVRDEFGQITNFFGIIQDITERKQAESEMLEARGLTVRTERLNALGAMAAGIAHEINQPLNSLKVLADGMLYWYEKGTVLEINEVMDTIQEISKQAGRIDTIIKQMRTFIQGNQLDKLVLCDINMAVEESLTFLDSQCQSHNIKVNTALATNLPPILGNSTQLEQIIINLLNNAIQALNTVEKPDKQISIITKREKNQDILIISDNGAGISKDLKSKIFNPFFTTKFAGEGMGLGLSIVHSIVTSYGGQIRVKDNKIAEGVTFWIGFPVAISKEKGRLFL